MTHKGRFDSLAHGDPDGGEMAQTRH
jgi:hypothetical protein